MTTPAVECREVSKRFGGVRALHALTLSVESGEILSVLGPSGSGKTTMLRVIAGFEMVNSGEVHIQGALASSPSAHRPPEWRQVGMVFQDYALFPHLTVSRNIEFGLGKLPSRERKKRLSEVVELTRLDGLGERYPHELSGGQQQRVALARTLAPRPVVVLLDEPFSNLDATLRLDVRREVEGILRENRATAIFVTHDREEAFAMADRVAVVRDGHVDQIESPDVLYHAPATPFVAAMSGVGDFIPARVRGCKAITQIGELPCTLAAGTPDDAPKAMLLVRPDDLQVDPSAEGACEVIARELRGDGIVLTVKLPLGTTIRCRQHHFSRLAPGARVDLKPSRPDPFLAFASDPAFLGSSPRG